MDLDSALLQLALQRELLAADAASEVSRSAAATGRSARELLVERGLLSAVVAAELESALRPGAEEAPTVVTPPPGAPPRTPAPQTGEGGARPAAASPFAGGMLPEGAVVDDFVVRGKLGQGGMGAVYRALQRSLGREVALKVIAPELAADVQAKGRFLREARAAAAISHPHVITVFQVGEAQGLVYVALELVRGGDAEVLAKRAGGRLPEARALEVIRDAARGLEAIERAGLVHRDIKPANIFLTEDGVAKLADLGLARSVAGDDRMTHTGAILGTPAYMAPEQADGCEVDVRADIYALGASLFRLVGGRAPYTGSSPLVVVAKVLKDPLPDPREVAPDLSQATVDVIGRALAKSPADRYPSARALRDALEQALQALPREEARDRAEDGAPTASPIAPPTAPVAPVSGSIATAGTSPAAAAPIGGRIATSSLTGADIAARSPKSDLAAAPAGGASRGTLLAVGAAALALGIALIAVSARDRPGLGGGLGHGAAGSADRVSDSPRIGVPAPARWSFSGQGAQDGAKDLRPAPSEHASASAPSAGGAAEADVSAPRRGLSLIPIPPPPYTLTPVALSAGADHVLQGTVTHEVDPPSSRLVPRGPFSRLGLFDPSDRPRQLPLEVVFTCAARPARDARGDAGFEAEQGFDPELRAGLFHEVGVRVNREPVYEGAALRDGALWVTLRFTRSGKVECLLRAVNHEKRGHGLGARRDPPQLGVALLERAVLQRVRADRPVEVHLRLRDDGYRVQVIHMGLILLRHEQAWADTQPAPLTGVFDRGVYLWGQFGAWADGEGEASLGAALLER